MTFGTPTPFGITLVQSQNQMGLSLITCLGWIAACDGHMDEREIQFLESVAAGGLSKADIDLAIRAARIGNVRDIQLACEVLRLVDDDQRRLLVDLIVGIAVVDGRLAMSENHAVRFFADLLGVSAASLDDIYRDHTGAPRPECSDLSSADWWAAQDGGRQSGRGSGQQSHQSYTAGSREEALAVLGLAPGATPDEIRLAYRRLARSHHPDKYESLGPEAVKAATNCRCVSRRAVSS